MIVFMFALAVAGLSLAEEPHYKQKLEAAVATGIQSNVLALLEDKSVPVSSVYWFAMSMLPKEDRVDFARSIPVGDARALCLANVLPRSEELNALLVEFYQTPGRGQAKLARRYSGALATKAQCIEFYELVLKNVPLNEETKPALEQIKSDLIKLKDL